jgi:hypothetical protein
MIWIKPTRAGFIGLFVGTLHASVTLVISEPGICSVLMNRDNSREIRGNQRHGRSRVSIELGREHIIFQIQVITVDVQHGT